MICPECNQSAEAGQKITQAQPALLRLVEKIAALKFEGEPDDDGDPFEPTSEDSIATLNQLILEARQLIVTADMCGERQEIVP